MQKVTVRRTGNADVRRASIDGVQLEWRSNDPSLSKTKSLPAGTHVFTWFVKGRKDQTYGFFFEEPPGVPCVVNPGNGLPSNGARDWGECEFELV